MAGQNDIKFIKGEGGLGTPLPNKDHQSGIVFLRSYGSAAPPAIPITYEKVSDLADAESKGLTEALYPEEYYQIKEFFRMQPDSILHVMFGAAFEATFDFAEVETIQNNANGELRQVAVMTYSAFVLTNVPLLQAVADTLSTNHKPLSIIYAGDLTGMDLSALPDLRSQSSPNVSVIIGMDGNNEGKALFDAGKIVPVIGATLGAVSSAFVNESIAHIADFKMSVDELDVPAFSNGDLYSATAVNLQNSLNDLGYIFLRTHIGIAGSYINENSTCTLVTSDYNFLNNVRVIDKAIRNTRVALLPKLNSSVTLTTAGLLSYETVIDWENIAKKALENMVVNGEISAYAVKIDPNQNIGTTSLLKINITLVIRGIARNVEVTIGYGSV